MVPESLQFTRVGSGGGLALGIEKNYPHLLDQGLFLRSCLTEPIIGSITFSCPVGDCTLQLLPIIRNSS